MTIQELTAQQKDYVIETRRWLHAHPELGCEEIETTKFICAELEKIGVEVQTFEGITGCVGTIHGAKPGKTVMLRADIDALPMQEKNQVPYASVNPGVMHSCGHDCHTAMLLGAARMLMQKRDELCGTVKLIFQMAEEIGRKSEEYVKRGALDNIDAIFGMHVWVHLPVGKCNFEAGPRMACSDRFTIQIHGEASHGSTPFLGKDAMVAAASAVMAIQGIVSRITDPRNPLVLTVGAMNGGQRMNILADHVEIVGTCRAFDREQRRQIPGLIENAVKSAAAVYGCTADCDYYFGPDPLINDDRELVSLAQKAAKEQLGSDCLLPLEKMTGAEDFSVYLTKAPGIYGYLGVRNEEKGITADHHNPLFDVDESALPEGAGIYARFALDYLSAHAK